MTEKGTQQITQLVSFGFSVSLTYTTGDGRLIPDEQYR